MLLDDFCFPNSEQYIFNGDKDAVLSQAAATILSNCTSADFTLSFCVTSTTFTLPAGLGMWSAEAFSTWSEPELDYNMITEGGDVTVTLAAGEEFIVWCAQFAAANNMEITVTVSDDPTLASEEIKKFL